MKTRSILFAVFILFFVVNLFAIEVKLGGDFVSRYVCRGLPYGGSACVQPNLSVSFGNFTISDWASYSLTSDDAAVDENDRILSYAIATSAGTFTPTVSDYFYPGGPFTFFDFDGVEDEVATGGHVIEAGLSYTGPENFPVGVIFAYCVHNDPDNSWYAELSYPFSVKDVSLSCFAGASSGESAFNGNISKNPQFTNMGISASKSIKITDSFSLPVSASVIVNPHLEKTFLVLKTSL